MRARIRMFLALTTFHDRKIEPRHIFLSRLAKFLVLLKYLPASLLTGSVTRSMGMASTSLLAVVCRSRLPHVISIVTSSGFTQAHRGFSTSANIRFTSTSASSSARSTSPLKEGQSSSIASRISDALSLPRFVIPASQIDLLQEPCDFYAALLAGIGRAKKRIFVSSLYIGKTEVELVSSFKYNPFTK